jgi:hypothetical protein
MAFRKRTFVVAAAVLAVGLPAYADLLQNGSFEDGNFQPDNRQAMLLGVGATDIAGWTVVNGGLSWDGIGNPYGLTASDGYRFLDLSGDHDNAPYAGVQQTVSTTIGAQYRLSFDIGTDPTYDPVAVSVSVTGVGSPPLFTSTPTTPNRWETFTFDFTAASANTTIALTGDVAGNASVAYIGLDNVSLNAIPEPGTLALIAGPGLLAFAAWRRLRKA